MRLRNIRKGTGANKNIALQTRLGAMRYQVSHLCIFSYDGTDRIRFAGQGYEAQSQPDASGPPKMDLFCDYLNYRWLLGKCQAIFKSRALPPRMWKCRWGTV